MSRRNRTFNQTQPAVCWNGGALLSISSIISNIMGEGFGRSTDQIQNALWTSYHRWNWYQWTINSHGNNSKFGQIHSRYPFFSSYESTVWLWRICISDKQKSFTYRSPIDHDHKTITMIWADQFFNEKEKHFKSMHSFTKSHFYPDHQTMGGLRYLSFGTSSLLVQQMALKLADKQRRYIASLATTTTTHSDCWI